MLLLLLVLYHTATGCLNNKPLNIIQPVHQEAMMDEVVVESFLCERWHADKLLVLFVGHHGHIKVFLQAGQLAVLRFP